MKKKLMLVAVLVGTACVGEIAACTTAVVSAKAASDGRPLLWKNRDADDLHNQVVYCADGRYAYLGVVNQGDVVGLEIWSGLNSAGLAIMNSASFNLPDGEDTKGEGAFMKLALQTCATVEEFESLLQKTEETKRDVAANFGVVDARGGAAYFETAPEGYKRYDAADAPGGWIVRSNYSDSQPLDGGTGFARRARAEALVGPLAAEKKLDARSLSAVAAKDVANQRIGSFPARGAQPGARLAYTGDSICRYDTASLFLVAGTKPGEDPLLATLWVVPAQPVTGAAVPLWVAAASVPPELAAGKDASPMTAACDALRARLYPDQKGDGKRYLDVAALSGEGGLLEPLLALESENFGRAERALAAWRQKGPAPAEAKALQEETARETVARLSRLAGVQAPPSPGTGKGE